MEKLPYIIGFSVMTLILWGLNQQAIIIITAYIIGLYTPDVTIFINNKTKNK